MQQLRFWLVALVVWLFALYNIERLHQPINIASFTYGITALFGAVIIAVPAVQRLPLAWLLLLPLPFFFCLKLRLHYPIGGTHLPITITELLAIYLTMLLALRIGHGLSEFRRAVVDTMQAQLRIRSRPFETGQGEIYREIRRARLYERPLALLVIAPREESVEMSLNRLVEEVQRETIREHAWARLAHLLSEETKDCDIITQRDGQFVTLLPEVGRDAALAVARRIAAAAREKLGVELRVGLSTFPDQEVTLEGLLERAESGLVDAPPAEAASTDEVASGRLVAHEADREREILSICLENTDPDQARAIARGVAGLLVRVGKPQASAEAPEASRACGRQAVER